MTPQDLYFKKVRVYPDGRGLYWPNGYDMCPDHLRYHVPGVSVTPSNTMKEADHCVEGGPISSCP